MPGFYFSKSEDVKRGLEKDKSLEEQFLQNGMEPASVQSSNVCDTIYHFAEKMAQYPDGEAGLSQYFRKEIAPILSNCIKRDEQIIASLYLLLTIDKKGNVVDAVVKRPQLTAECDEELRKKLLTMNGWIPAQLNKEAVCSYFLFPVGCILWK
jgi:hypothetical protein